MPKQSNPFNAVKREFNNSYNFVEAMHAIENLRDAVDGKEPATGFEALGRSLHYGLLFGASLMLKLVLIVVFNVVAVMLFFWLLSIP